MYPAWVCIRTSNTQIQVSSETVLTHRKNTLTFIFTIGQDSYLKWQRYLMTNNNKRSIDKKIQVTSVAMQWKLCHFASK